MVITTGDIPRPPVQELNHGLSGRRLHIWEIKPLWLDTDIVKTEGVGGFNVMCFASGLFSVLSRVI